MVQEKYEAQWARLQDTGYSGDTGRPDTGYMIGKVGLREIIEEDRLG